MPFPLRFHPEADLDVLNASLTPHNISVKKYFPGGDLSICLSQGFLPRVDMTEGKNWITANNRGNDATHVC